jgi:hypothetical protein
MCINNEPILFRMFGRLRPLFPVHQIICTAKNEQTNKVLGTAEIDDIPLYKSLIKSC